MTMIPEGQIPKSLVLLLIKEELKSHKFFNHLRVIGFDDSPYQTDLSEAILTYTGLNDRSDETLDFYYFLMEEHCAEMDLVSVMDHARLVFDALVAERKRRNGA